MTHDPYHAQRLRGAFTVTAALSLALAVGSAGIALLGTIALTDGHALGQVGIIAGAGSTIGHALVTAAAVAGRAASARPTGVDVHRPVRILNAGRIALLATAGALVLDGLLLAAGDDDPATVAAIGIGAAVAVGMTTAVAGSLTRLLNALPGNKPDPATN